MAAVLHGPDNNAWVRSSDASLLSMAADNGFRTSCDVISMNLSFKASYMSGFIGRFGQADLAPFLCLLHGDGLLGSLLLVSQHQVRIRDVR